MRLADIIWTVIGIIFSLILLAVVISYAHKWWLRTRFWLRYGSKGRNILFVYSDSPNWKEYIELNILPRIERYAVTLNWSERKKWKDEHLLESKVFKRWAGYREFNPVAIVFQPVGKVRVIRFWQAFRDYKHGKEGPLKRAEEELFGEVSERTTNAV